MYIRSVIYEKKTKWLLLKGDGMVTEWHWMVTEWPLKCTCHSVDWMVTERWLNGAFQFSRNGGVSKARKRYPFEWIVALVVYMTTSASPYRVTGLASVVNFNILSPNSLTINLIMNPFVVLVQKSLFMTRFYFKSSVLKHIPSSIFWPSFRKNIPLNELLLLLYPWLLLLHL